MTTISAQNIGAFPSRVCAVLFTEYISDYLKRPRSEDATLTRTAAVKGFQDIQGIHIDRNLEKTLPPFGLHPALGISNPARLQPIGWIAVRGLPPSAR